MLFKYNLKEKIHIYWLIKQYLKHEMIWRQNVLLKQKVMFISCEIIVKRDRRRSVDGSVDTVLQASVCTSIVD